MWSPMRSSPCNSKNRTSGAAYVSHGKHDAFYECFVSWSFSLTRSSFPFFVLSLALSASAFAQTPAYLDTHLSPEQRAHDLVSRMTLEEKAEQGINTAPAIPRLGVPAYDYWSEGLHGIARSGYATLFPQAIGMAATFDAPLLGKVGDVVSTEARAKYNRAVAENIHSIYFGLTIWSPNINIFRDPRWGRGQETYGEDPFLTGSLGLEFVKGLQGPDPLHPRVIATPKHYAVHSGPESTRHSADIDPTSHDLWDTYLPQFRRAIVEGKADSIMCAYNAVDGKPACGSDLLLKTVLRGDWKFNGFVTSDCGAVSDFFEKNAHAYSKTKEQAAADAVLAGTDTNCGSTYKALPGAVKQGLLTEADVDRAIERLFVARIRLGLFDPPAGQPYANLPYSEVRSPQHLALSLETARESMVLLKNDGILPLAAGKYKTIAVVGPNAASLSALEGNYNAVPKDPQMPVDALREAFRGAKVVYAEGAPYADGVALPVPSTMLRPSLHGEAMGLKAEYFAGNADDMASSFNSKPVVTRTDEQIDFDWASAAPVTGLKQDAFAVRWTGFIQPMQTGAFDFDVRFTHCYPCNDQERLLVKIDGKDVHPLASTAGQGSNNRMQRFHVDFADTQLHAIEIEYTHHAPLFGAGLVMEWVPPSAILQKQAVDVAAGADLVVAMVGLSPQLEGEEMNIHVEGFAGGDRTDIKLPASQERLLEAIAAAGKPLVVVLLNGSALSVNWAHDHANAILEAWYPGEFGGRAIAETLMGVNNPGGRLPVTVYHSLADLPKFSDYSMKNRTYRYFSGKPLYEFGYGLSYTKFSYSGLRLSTASLTAGQSMTAEVEVRNSGHRGGEEVAQLYLVPPSAANGGLSPKLQLEGFQRIYLKPGEKRKLTFALTPRELSEVDSQGVRSVQAGAYSLSVGGSQPNDPNASAATVTTTFEITGNSALPN
jgi:beta-glucosidase